MKASRVQREIFMMGLSPRHKGFHYISEAICAGGTAPPGERCAGIPDEGTENAERCMRYAIRYAWDVGGGEIRKLFPNSEYPPSPVEFIHAMLWKLDE